MKQQKYYRSYDITKPPTVAKITADRCKNNRTPSRWHLLPYTAQKIDRNPPKVITREDCKST